MVEAVALGQRAREPVLGQRAVLEQHALGRRARAARALERLVDLLARGEPHVDDHVGQEALRGAAPRGLGQAGSSLRRRRRRAVARRSSAPVAALRAPPRCRRRHLRSSRIPRRRRAAVELDVAVESSASTSMSTSASGRRQLDVALAARRARRDQSLSRSAVRRRSRRSRAGRGSACWGGRSSRALPRRCARPLAASCARQLLRMTSSGALAPGPQLEAERTLGDEDLEPVERARAVRARQRRAAGWIRSGRRGRRHTSTYRLDRTSVPVG